MLVPPWYELPPPGYGGLEQVCAALVDALVARGHQVTLIGAGARSGTAARFVSTVAQPQHPRLGDGLPEYLHVARANRLIEESGVDVVHDHTMAGLLSVPSRPVPTVATVHGCPTGEIGDYLSYVDRSVSLVAISAAQRRLRPELPWAATIHHGLPAGTSQVRSVAPEPAEPDNRPVLWLARFSPDKGPDMAIEACRKAGLPLVLAGKCAEPEERRYLSEVIAPMLSPDVELVLNADRRRSHALLQAARCLIMPIRWEEPFGMVVIEAMAAGTPVVALSRGAIPELVQHGVTGLVCSGPGELPDALHQVTAIDPAACVAQLRSRFSADLMAQRYEQVYRAAIAGSLLGTDRTSLVAGPPLRPTVGVDLRHE
jgi:glycosyltransferase involved in cell wall biosynthesis